MEDIKVVLDLGNGYIKGAVFGIEQGKNIVLVKESIRTKGMRKGKILDMDDLTMSITAVLDSFVKKLGEHFYDEVCIGISHPEMIIKRVTEQKRILNNMISQDDVNHLLNVINDTSGEANYETIKIIPVQWIIDDQIKLKDPVGMEGRKLELVADIFMVPKNYFNTLTEVFEKLQIDIGDVVPNILGVSEVALDFDSKDLGTLLIDIGNNQTSYVVYEEGYPLKYGILPIGGEDVTKDVSIGLQIDIKEAENIKKDKGTILIEEARPKDETLDVGFLSDIMSARYEEILEKINEQLIEIGMDGKLPGGVILIGGGARVRNIDLLAKNVFKLASSTGKDKILGVGEMSNNVQMLNLLGCYYWYNKYTDEKKGGFSIGFDFGFVRKIGQFFKDLF